MNFVSVPIHLLTDEKFLTANDAQKGAWVSLMLFCAATENQGIVQNCKSWPSQVWTGKASVKKCLIEKPSPLWTWEEDSLRVEFYSVEMEELATRKSRNGKAAAGARWAKREQCESDADALQTQCKTDADALQTQCESDAVKSKGVKSKSKEEERERIAGAKGERGENGTGELKELIEMLQTCREDFRFKRAHLEKILIGAQKNGLRKVIETYCMHVANMVKIPDNPVGLLQRYIANGDIFENADAGKGPPWKTSAEVQSEPIKRFSHGE